MIKKIKKIIKKNFTKNYWQSDASCKWHGKRQKEAHNDFDTFAQAFCEKINGLNFQTVIEVGTGAGTCINLISKKLTSCNRFIGIDINQQQINENKKAYENIYNVEFVYMGIEKYIKENKLDNVVIVAQNTFDYFDKKELEKLFALIYRKMDNVAIAVSTFGKNKKLGDSVESHEADFKVFNHNYYALLESAGYELMDTTPYGDDEDSVIVVGHKIRVQ